MDTADTLILLQTFAERGGSIPAKTFDEPAAPRLALVVALDRGWLRWESGGWVADDWYVLTNEGRRMLQPPLEPMTLADWALVLLAAAFGPPAFVKAITWVAGLLR